MGPPVHSPPPPPPLEIDMPIRVPSARTLPNPIQTQLTPSISVSRGKESFPSVSPRDHDDNCVIPSYHESRARTLVLCFDGTGDQFNADVRALSGLCVAC